jgi:hypothetical protein
MTEFNESARSKCPVNLFASAIPMFMLLWALVFSIFGYHLAIAPSEVSWYRLGGFVPYSDAGAYFTQIVNWPADFFDQFNSRRPFNATLNILHYDAGARELLGLLLVRSALMSLSIAFLTTALVRVVGILGGLASGLILIAWSLPYVGTMLSETNGITLAAAGYACLLLGMHSERFSWIAWGLVGLAFATALRPYNPALPALACASFFVFGHWPLRKKLLVALTSALIATVITFGITRIAYAAYGNPEGAPGGNTGYTVLGIARGTDWMEAGDYVSKNYPPLNERQLNDLMYDLALQAVLKDPKPAAKSLLNGLWGAVNDFPVQVLGSLNFNNVDHRSAMVLVSYAIVLAFLIVCSKGSASPVVILLFVSLVAFLTMAPVIYTDGGWRIAASLYPGLALIASTPFLLLQEIWARNRTDYKINAAPADKFRRETIVPAMMVILVSGVSLPYPLLARALRTNSPKDDPCASVAVKFDDGISPAHWTGFSQGRAPQDTREKWMQLFDFKEWAAFFSEHRHSVSGLSHHNGELIVLVKDAAAITDKPDAKKMHPWAPQLHIQLSGEHELKPNATSAPVSGDK